MDMFQYIMLGLGAIVVLSSLNFGKAKDFLLGLLPKKEKKIVVIPSVNVPVGLANNPVTAQADLVSSKTPKSVIPLIGEWEDVRNMCEELSLEKSVTKLDDVYPTFLELLQRNKKEPVQEPVKTPIVESVKVIEPETKLLVGE